jgi:ribokinase
MVKILVLASFNMDLVMRTPRQPQRGETLQGEFATYLGGKGFNQAIAARRLGADVAVIGRVGDDEFGARFLAALDAEGIDRRHVSVDSVTGTGVASIIVDDSGENAIVQAPQANRKIRAADIDAANSVFEGANAALLQLETSGEAALRFAEAARDAGARVVLNPAPAAPVRAGLLRAVDVILPNEPEAAALTGTEIGSVDDALSAADTLHQSYGAAAVITLSERGAAVVADDLRQHVPAFRVAAIDTVGAGDAFCAALAVALAERASLDEAVRFANAAGALATTKPGAEPSMPQRNDIEALLAKGAMR